MKREEREKKNNNIIAFVDSYKIHIAYLANVQNAICYIANSKLEKKELFIVMFIIEIVSFNLYPYTHICIKSFALI